MDLFLKNKVVPVTGGAKGIGEGIVRTLAAEGAIPVIVGRNQEDNLRLLAEISSSSPESIEITAELTDPTACQFVVEQLVKTYGRVDGLVNNAGVNDGVGLEKGDYSSFISSLHKNLVHYFLMAHHCLPYLKKSRGAILNISSKTGETGQGGTSGYAAANGGRNALTREWAVELLPFGIRVNAIIVSECYTPLYKKWVESFSNSEQKLREISNRIPFGKRMTTEQEIANMAVFLLSERSSHTTGQLMYVDGGYVHLDRAIN
ncbi:MAG: SDR family oxidoreductase [Cyclobacteriaceae bacterium]